MLLNITDITGRQAGKQAALASSAGARVSAEFVAIASFISSIRRGSYETVAPSQVMNVSLIHDDIRYHAPDKKALEKTQNVSAKR